MTGVSRRVWLARMAAGTTALALAMTGLRRALAQGEVAPGIARVRGEARVNGKPAQRGMEVSPGDVVTTGRNAELVAEIGRAHV